MVECYKRWSEETSSADIYLNFDNASAEEIQSYLRGDAIEVKLTAKIHVDNSDREIGEHKVFIKNQDLTR